MNVLMDKRVDRCIKIFGLVVVAIAITINIFNYINLRSFMNKEALINYSESLFYTYFIINTLYDNIVIDKSI